MIRQLIRAELERQAVSHIGVVEAAEGHSSDADAVNYSCDVRLRGLDLVLKGVPLAADQLSTVSMPTPGDLVFVQFAGGNPDQPVITGRLFSDQLRPPPYDKGQIVTQLPPGGEESDRIDLVLQAGQNGSRSLTLKLPSDITVTVTDTAVQVEAGKLSLLLDAQAGEAVVKSSGASVTLSGTNLTLKADGDVTLEATGNMTVKGAQLKLNASGTAELKGAMVNIN